MRGIGRRVCNLFAAGVLGAMGFGAVGAFARAAEAAAPPGCNPVACQAMCEGRFGPFAHGECHDDQCLCAI